MFVFAGAYVRVAGSFAGLGFLSWYLAGKMTAFDRRGHVAKLCVVLLPLLVAALVAVSRVDDYWHHWQDVCTGGVLGTYVGALLLITARKRVVLLGGVCVC
jgi:membrane-associated phospholipid phosphatase